MTYESPEERPTIEEVIEMFRDSFKLSTIKLRHQNLSKEGPRLFTAFRHVQQSRLIHTRYIVLKRVAILRNLFSFSNCVRDRILRSTIILLQPPGPWSLNFNQRYNSLI